jgi:hypothetical protein
MAGWMGYGAVAPMPYNYGETVYYQDNNVYSGGQPVATTEQYTQQAAKIASSVNITDPAQSKWMSLGVFALTQDGQASGSTPSQFMQLTISKEGYIAGTLSNQLTGETQTLEGMADKQSQRAAWTVKGQDRPIVETGLNNLTQDSAPVLVHYADGQTHQMLLVRLPQQQTQAQSQ